MTNVVQFGIYETSPNYDKMTEKGLDTMHAIITCYRSVDVSQMGPVEAATECKRAEADMRRLVISSAEKAAKFDEIVALVEGSIDIRKILEIISR